MKSAIYNDDPIHLWFELSYASYLCVPRSVLQSMPQKWQKKLVKLLDEMPEELEIDDMPDYRVNAVNDRGRFIQDPYRDYSRGRRQIPKKNETNN